MSFSSASASTPWLPRRAPRLLSLQVTAPDQTFGVGRRRAMAAHGADLEDFVRSASLPSVPADSAEPAANIPSTMIYASPQMHD